MSAGQEADLNRSLELPYLIAPAQRQRLDLVHHLLEFGNQVVVVQGAPGSGRTRMLECICSEAEATWTVAEAHDEIESPQTLLRFLALCLSIHETADDNDIDESIARIRDELARLESDRCLCVLAIDDADRLSDDLCALLFTLAHAEDSVGELRILLTGSSESDTSSRLLRIAALPSLVHVVDIPPLNTTQISELIVSFSQATGRDDLFANLDPARLAPDAPGNPAKTIGALYELLEGARSTDADPAVPDSVRYRRYALISLVLLLSAAVVLFIGNGNDETQIKEREIGLPGNDRGAEPQAVQSPDGAQTATAEIEPVGNDAAASNLVASIDPSPAEPTLPSVSATDPNRFEFTGGDPATPTAPALEPDPEGRVAIVTLEETPGAAPTITPAPQPTARNTAPEAITEGVQSLNLDDAEDPTNTSDATTAPYSREWVLTQDPNSYVIQLLGVRDRGSALRFIQAHDLQSNGAVIELIHEGAPWYVLVFGHYPDRDAALAAIKDLAPALARLNPWARPVLSLHN